ncbi:MAG: DegV family protein [Brevinema sp.]
MSLLKNLSGKELYWSILSGSKKMIEHQEEINSINVFPVPDGDTGSNLAATATSIIYNSTETDCVQTVASSIGEAALDGARGNSGVIFAQFLYGISMEIKDVASINTQMFADIIKKASDYVYKAIPSPKEGTIITVIREWADYIQKNSQKYNDFENLFTHAEKKIQEALARTTEQLEALKLAKVVDAGAKGFVLFVEGMRETIKNRAFSREDHDMEHLLMADYDLPMAEAEILTEESLHNRYCTETCIAGENISREDVLQVLEEDSDSIVIAGGEKKLRLHFHTNHPAEMFGKLRKFGNFTFQKVEDMRLQYNVTHHRKAPIAFVVDSGVTLTAEFMEENQIHFLPAHIEIDGVSYQDNRTITLDIFRNIVTEKNPVVKTSQVSPKNYADLFGYLSHYYESIIVLSMGSGVSGTYNSALQGKQLVQSKTDIKIDIIDSCHLASAAGAMAHVIAQNIKEGVAHDDIVQGIYKDLPNTKNYINFHTIDHLIRSGRLGAFKGGVIKALGLAPVLEMKDGKPAITGKAFGFKKAIQKSLDAIQKQFKNYKGVKGYTLSHTFLDEEIKTFYLQKLEEIFGKAPFEVSIASPCLGNHVGMGAVCVGVIYED